MKVQEVTELQLDLLWRTEEELFLSSPQPFGNFDSRVYP